MASAGRTDYNTTRSVDYKGFAQDGAVVNRSEDDVKIIYPIATIDSAEENVTYFVLEFRRTETISIQRGQK